MPHSRNGDPCRSHPCDGCRACRNGWRCRRDDPNDGRHTASQASRVAHDGAGAGGAKAGQAEGNALATRRLQPLGPLQITLLEQLARPTTELWVNLDAHGNVTSASALFDIGDGMQFVADVDAARIRALIRRGLLAPSEPAKNHPDGTAFQRYDLSRVGLAQLPDDGSRPTLHDRLFGTRLVERYAMELAACAGHGYARSGRGTVLVVPVPGPRPAATFYTLTMTYVPLLRLAAMTHNETSLLDLCNDYDPAMSFVLALSFSLMAGTTYYRLSPQHPALGPPDAARQCPDPDPILRL